MGRTEDQASGKQSGEDWGSGFWKAEWGGLRIRLLEGRLGRTEDQASGRQTGGDWGSGFWKANWGGLKIRLLEGIFTDILTGKKSVQMLTRGREEEKLGRPSYGSLDSKCNTSLLRIRETSRHWLKEGYEISETIHIPLTLLRSHHVGLKKHTFNIQDLINVKVVFKHKN